MKKPYFILPFDHRSTFAKALLHFDYPTTPEQTVRVKEMKRVVFDAFLEARVQMPALVDHMAILIDLEYGVDIIRDARKKGIPFALSTEKSGQNVFDFEYGDKFNEVLIHEVPEFAKALVRYDLAKRDENKVQRDRLKQLSHFCANHQIKLMLEVLIEGEGAHLDHVLTMIQEMTQDDILPSVWKLEGLESAEDWKSVAKATPADLIMLGRGESQDDVEDWIHTASGSSVVHGFAIGRTIFMVPLEWYRDEKISREEAVQMIAKNYLHFIRLWQKM